MDENDRDEDEKATVSKLSSPNRLLCYKSGTILGRGTYGIVRRAIHKLSGEPVALKEYRKGSKSFETKSNDAVGRSHTEIKILETISHPNIVRFYETIETNTKKVLVMEHCEGECLRYMIADKRRLSESAARRILHQLADATTYLHSKRIAHLDIKPENIIICNEDPIQIKLIDFGFSVRFSVGQIRSLKSFCGTPCFMAPEIVARTAMDGRPADIWSMGVLLYFMVVGKLPFDGYSEEKVYSMIKKGLYARPKKVSRSFLDLLSRMLQVDPIKRIRADMIMRHAWMRKEQIDSPHSVGLSSALFVASRDMDTKIMQRLLDAGLSTHEIHDELSFRIHSGATTWYRLLHQQMIADSGLHVAGSVRRDETEVDSVEQKHEPEHGDNDQCLAAVTAVGSFSDFLKAQIDQVRTKSFVQNMANDNIDNLSRHDIH